MATNVNLQQLRLLISQWNENRMELFNLSEPNEYGEFHGVMRFYFQERGEKVSTKCIRVSSSATTKDVIDALIEKFHPDMKMLTISHYTIWEVHENGEERKLQLDERPLVVQLTWHKDDREGRFLLRNEDEKRLSNSALQQYDENNANIKRSTKRFSKREKKEPKKARDPSTSDMFRQKNDDLATHLYKEVPQNLFNRTLSNPEIVMKKRREKNLLNKLKEIGHGGSLKIYGSDLVPTRPYVTILVGVNDRAEKIIRDTLEKYGLEKEDPRNFVLVEVSVPQNENRNRSISDLRSISGSERVLPNDECPLMTLLSKSEKSSEIIFAIRPRNLGSATLPKTTLISSPSRQSINESQYQRISNSSFPTTLPVTYAYDPILVPLERDGKEVTDALIDIRPQVTEIGSDPMVQGIKLSDPNIHPKHCCLMFIDGVVTVTPLNANAVVEVNGIRIERTLMLREGFTLAIGQHQFRFYLSRLQYMNQHPHVFKNGAVNYGIPKSQSQPMEMKPRPRALPLSSSYHRIRAPIKPVSQTPNPFRSSQANLSQSAKVRSVSETDLRMAETSVKELNFSSNVLGQMLRSTNHIPVGTRFSSNANIPNTTNRPTTPVTMPDSAPTPQLPAWIELYDQAVEQDFLRALIHDSPPERFPFRPSPSLILYMVCRYRISPHFRPGLSRPDRQIYLQTFLMKVLEKFYHIVHFHSSNSSLLIYYLANISEFLHILKADHELANMSGSAVQGRYFELVEKTFDLLVGSCLTGIQSTMSGLLSIHLNHNEATRDLLNYLEETVRLIRKCRLNPALTIQVFSQLFYFVNMYVFNWLVTTTDGSRFISRAFGATLRDRLNLVNKWAEQQGLELAAECHMDRIQQTVNFLVTPKTNDQIASLGATCYKLNSIQVRYLLENYVRDQAEMPITKDLIETVQSLAIRQADIMAVQDGTKVQLEESPNLQLPFLFPQDGFVVETFRGISEDMSQFINSLQAKGICRLLPQHSSSGSWTVHMTAHNSLPSSSSNERIAHVSGNNHFPTHALDHSLTGPLTLNGPLTNGIRDTSSQHLKPSTNFGVSSHSPSTNSSNRSQEIQHITLQRPPGSGIGLSIVAAQGVGDKTVGIYVKSVVDGSVAQRDGRLESGDQLLSVNGQSLLDITQEQAAQKIASSGSSVHFEVAKHKAMSNGLHSWLQTTPSTPGSVKSLIPPPNGSLPAVSQPATNFNANCVDSTNKYGQISPNLRQTHAPPTQDVLYKHYRSNSASALMKDPVDTSSLASTASHQPVYSSLSSSRLPPHYRPASRPVVVQPSRPISPSNLRRAISPSQLLTAGSKPAFRSASTIPFSTNSSLPSPPYGVPQREAPKLPPMTKSELNEELERLEIKGPALTEADRQRYHQLLSQLADFKPNSSKSETEMSKPSKSNLIHDPMDDVRYQATNPSTSEIHKHKEDIISSVENLASRSMTANSHAEERYRYFGEANISHNNIRTLETPSPLAPALRTSPNDEKGKKRVTFNELKDQSEDCLKENQLNNISGTPMSAFERIVAPAQHTEDDDDGQPRVQIIGAQEVYRNDPRQRRLNEIQSKLRKPAVDGANLAFRDKMKMFAAQIGEQMPKPRYKTSSTEREIEKEPNETHPY